jgi:hypothetical protein
MIAAYFALPFTMGKFPAVIFTTRLQKSYFSRSAHRRCQLAESACAAGEPAFQPCNLRSSFPVKRMARFAGIAIPLAQSLR